MTTAVRYDKLPRDATPIHTTARLTGESIGPESWIPGGLATNLLPPLTPSIHDEITKLCEQGDALSKSGDFRGALRLFHRSLKLLPEPKEDWDAATWILSAIGDAHFFLGDFQNVIAALSNAVHCPNGLGNPFVHLRLGEAAFELRQMDKAKEELTRAYIGAGRDVFANEDPKYLAYLETILQPMPGHDKL